MTDRDYFSFGTFSTTSDYFFNIRPFRRITGSKRLKNNTIFTLHGTLSVTGCKVDGEFVNPKGIRSPFSVLNAVLFISWGVIAI